MLCIVLILFDLMREVDYEEAFIKIRCGKLWLQHSINHSDFYYNMIVKNRKKNTPSVRAGRVGGKNDRMQEEGRLHKQIEQYILYWFSLILYIHRNTEKREDDKESR